MKLFVSYRRKDWPFTQSLVEKLRLQLYARVFMDVDSVREDDFSRNLMSELASSDAVLLIVSPNTFAADRINNPNDWVRREIRYALELGKPLIMAGIDGLTPPNADALPEDIRALHNKQSIGFWPGFFDPGVLKLAKFIEQATPINRRSTVYRRRAISALTVLVLVLLVYFGNRAVTSNPTVTPPTTAVVVQSTTTATQALTDTRTVNQSPTNLPETPTATTLPTLTFTPTWTPTTTSSATSTGVPTLQSTLPGTSNVPQSILIKGRFPAPGREAEGITSDGSSLWITDNSGSIFKVDASGNLLDVIASPEVTPQGITWDGSSFWVFTTNYSLIYQFQVVEQAAKTMSHIRSPGTVIGGGITQDMAWDGIALWYANQYKVYRLDTLGNILSSFAVSENVTGLDWDGSNLWLAMNKSFENATLRQVNTTGKTLKEFRSPVYEIDGFAWMGGYLWAIGRDATGGNLSVYKLEVTGP